MVSEPRGIHAAPLNSKISSCIFCCFYNVPLYHDLRCRFIYLFNHGDNLLQIISRRLNYKRVRMFTDLYRAIGSTFFVFGQKLRHVFAKLFSIRKINRNNHRHQRRFLPLLLLRVFQLQVILQILYRCYTEDITLPYIRQHLGTQDADERFIPGNFFEIHTYTSLYFRLYQYILPHRPCQRAKNSAYISITHLKAYFILGKSFFLGKYIAFLHPRLRRYFNGTYL